MPIKVGFSTSACPEWDIEKTATEASRMGFYGVELADSHSGHDRKIAVGSWTEQEIDHAGKLFHENNVELVSLACEEALEAPSGRALEQAVQRIEGRIELAARLGCQFVRVSTRGSVTFDTAGRVLGRLATVFAKLAEAAARHHVTLLACNGRSFPDSRSLWIVVDAVSHPNFACAWNPLIGLGARDRNTVAIPRLGRSLRIIAAGDGHFGERGEFQKHAPIGRGAVDWETTIDLLKGVFFDGYLMVDGSGAGEDNSSDPSDALTEAFAILMERIKHSAGVLNAYKGDKKPANYGQPPKAFVELAAKAKSANPTEVAIESKD